MSTPRFVDGVNASVGILNNLLQTYMPLQVDWTIGQTSYTLKLQGLTVRLENRAGMTVTAISDIVPRKQLDSLRNALRNAVEAALGEPSWSTMGFGVLLLQLGEEALSHAEAFNNSQNLLKLQRLGRQAGEKLVEGAWDATSSDWKSVLSNPLGVDLLTVNDTAKFLLGRSITEILAELPSALRVLHVEPVFRNDLVAKFARRRATMREHLASLSSSSLRKCIKPSELRRGKDTVEDMAEILSTPEVTFHGAPRKVMQSIVRYGFVVPGKKIGDTGVENGIACGASFGIGIYSSPSIDFASAYAYDNTRSGEWRNPADVPGMRIVVCATLMGRPIEVSREATRRTEGISDQNADSHVSPNGLEYIVFDEAQIIPCYVLHLDYGSESAKKHFERYQKQPFKAIKLQSRVDCAPEREAEDTPAAKVARKEALKAAASKWFPYGYGPATGTNFVIEEIGDVSDDEEEYGEYQGLRGAQEDDLESFHTRSEDEKTSWFDEFQTVRTTKKQVRVGR
jgi:hypothetical protein